MGVSIQTCTYSFDGLIIMILMCIYQVHERDKDTDFCLLLVKTFLRSNSRNVKVHCIYDTHVKTYLHVCIKCNKK